MDGDGTAEIIVSGKVGSDDTRFIMLEDNGSNAIVKHDWNWPSGWINGSDDRQFLTYGNFGGSNLGFVAIHTTDYHNTDWEMEMWEWNGTAMVSKWSVSHTDTDNRRGSHQAIVADLDDDGKEEIAYGTVAVDDDGSILWDVTLKTFGSR